MWGVGRLVSWAIGWADEATSSVEAPQPLEASEFLSPASKHSECSEGFTSPVSLLPELAEEFEDSHGKFVEGDSENEASYSPRNGFPDKIHPRVELTIRSQIAWTDEQNFYASSSAAEDNDEILQARLRAVRPQTSFGGRTRASNFSKNKYYGDPQSTRNTILSGDEGSRGGPVLRGSTRQHAMVTSSERQGTSGNALTQQQLRKLHKLVPLDKDWDERFPNVYEAPFDWPPLSEADVALGQLESKRSLVVLSCLKAGKLTLEQINNVRRMPLEDVAQYVAQEDAMRRHLPSNYTAVNKAWVKNDKPLSFECHVQSDGTCEFQISAPMPSTLLHRTFGEDRVMPVYFSKWPSSIEQYVEGGILVGLRRYRLWTFKDTGKEENRWKKGADDSDKERSVKCYFICTESLADVDIEDSTFKYFLRIHAARCHIMHIHMVTTVPKFSLRLQLALSKSMSVDIDLSQVNIKMIDDILCTTLDESGNKMSHTDGTGQISPCLARKCPASVFKGQMTNDTAGEEDYPTLLQVRLFYGGKAIKGTLAVNHKLPSATILYRKSMLKVDSDSKLDGFPTVNSLELLCTNRKPKDANLSKDLIALLTICGVPGSFFLDHVHKRREDIQNIITTRKAAYEEVKNNFEDQTYRDQTYRMLVAGIPMNHPQMQKNLKRIAEEKLLDLRKGCVPIPDTYYLMATADPSGLLKPNQVAISMGDGKVYGKVLVYRNPGKHWGDIRPFEAVWDERLDPFVEDSKYTIFFSTQGDRPVVDEIANGDLDGDRYWVCRNKQVLKYFEEKPAWKRSRGGVGNSGQVVPSNLPAHELEIAVFRRFLKARFKGSMPPMPMAADYLLAHLDEFLTVTDAERKSYLSETMEELNDLYKRALDAGKTGEEVQLPAHLKPQKWPHHMKKERSNKDKSNQERRDRRIYYHSKSILGQIYDLGSIGSDSLGYPPLDSMVMDPHFKFGNYTQYKPTWENHLMQWNPEIQAAYNSGSKEAPDNIIAKYRKFLLESKNPVSQRWERKPVSRIWEEASALYSVNCEYASRKISEQKIINMGYPPSLHFAMSVAGIELCEIYARNLEGEPYTWANSIRGEIFRPT